MLESILRLRGVKALEKRAQKDVKGGFNLDGGCPVAGDCCITGAFDIGVVTLPCMGDAEVLECINGTWTVA